MASDAQPREGWVEEMKVTFDSDELSSFFDGFEPLEIGDDGFPIDPSGFPESDCRS